MIVTKAGTKFMLAVCNGKVWLALGPGNLQFELEADESLALAAELKAIAEIAKEQSHDR